MDLLQASEFRDDCREQDDDVENDEDEAGDVKVAFRGRILDFSFLFAPEACDQFFLVRAVAQLVLVAVFLAHDGAAAVRFAPDLGFAAE